MMAPEETPASSFSLPMVSNETCFQVVMAYRDETHQKHVLEASTAKVINENVDLYHAMHKWLPLNAIPEILAPIAVGQAIGLYGILYDQQIIDRELAQLNARLGDSPRLTTEHLPTTFFKRNLPLRARFARRRAGVPEISNMPQVLPEVSPAVLRDAQLVRSRDILAEQNPHLLDIICECRLGELVAPRVFPLANAANRANIARISLFMYDALNEAGKANARNA